LCKINESSSPIFWTPPGLSLPKPQEEGVVLTTEEREETSEEPGPGPGWKSPYDKWNFSWENHGKTMEKQWKNHGKTMEKPGTCP
jgi:hypothetical protein